MRSDPERSDYVADWRAAVEARLSIEDQPYYSDIDRKADALWRGNMSTVAVPLTIDCLIHPYMRTKYATYEPERPIGEI